MRVGFACNAVILFIAFARFALCNCSAHVMPLDYSAKLRQWDSNFLRNWFFFVCCVHWRWHWKIYTAILVLYIHVQMGNLLLLCDCVKLTTATTTTTTKTMTTAIHNRKYNLWQQFAKTNRISIFALCFHSNSIKFAIECRNEFTPFFCRHRYYHRNPFNRFSHRYSGGDSMIWKWFFFSKLIELVLIDWLRSLQIFLRALFMWTAYI